VPPRIHAHGAQPDTIPGDIIFVIQQKEHAIFKRKGAGEVHRWRFCAC
jgi:DnaJ-class molecular chaperone